MIESHLQPYPAYKPSGLDWLGDVPAHWDLVQLGRIGRFSKGSGGTKADEVPEGVPCIRYGDLYTSHKFHIRASRSCVSETDALNYTPLRYGDILFAGSGETIEEIGKSAVNLIDQPACCGGDVILFRSAREIDATFSGYAIDCPASQYQKSTMGRGITVMHIYGSELKYLWLPLPPLPEQHTIARYLDHVDRRIQRYIQAKQKRITLLHEARQAIIHRAVTRGLDPDVPLKPSGVDWLGDIPVHWEVNKASRLFSIGSGTTPPTERSEYYGGGIPWITTSELRETVVTSTAKTVTEEALSDFPALNVFPEGSIAVAMYGATIGRLGILGVPATVNQACCVFSEPNGMKARFWFYWLQSRRQYLTSHGLGGGQPNLSQKMLRSIQVTVPPLLEQTAIVAHLDQATAAIDAAIDTARRQSELMRAYRASLIAHVVTGKLDVRAAAAQLPPESAEQEPVGR